MSRIMFTVPSARPDESPTKAPCGKCNEIATRVPNSYRSVDEKERWGFVDRRYANGDDLFECPNGHRMRLERLIGVEWDAGPLLDVEDVRLPESANLETRTQKPVTRLPDPGRDTVGMAHLTAGDTEHAAALAVTPRTGTARRRVLDAVAAAGARGRTAEELIDELGMDGNTVRPRIVELKDGGWLEDTGDRRPTRSGQSAIVWGLTKQGARQRSRAS